MIDIAVCNADVSTKAKLGLINSKGEDGGRGARVGHLSLPQQDYIVVVKEKRGGEGGRTKKSDEKRKKNQEKEVGDRGGDK